MLELLLALTITGHAPTQAGWGNCQPNPGRTTQVQAVIVYRVGHQAPAWRKGCEANKACWDSVKVQAAPIQVASVGLASGEAFSITVPDSFQYMVTTRTTAGVETTCWQLVRIP